MQWEWIRLDCAIAGQVATLTKVGADSEARPSEAGLAAGGIVVNLSSNVSDFFKVTSTTGQKYRVLIQRES